MTQDAAALPPELETRPRRVRWARKRDFWGLVGVRLFILPHMLIGVGAACYLVGLLAWVLIGSDVSAQATSVWLSTRKSVTTHHASFTYIVGGQTLRSSSHITADEFAALTAAGVPLASSAPSGPSSLPPAGDVAAPIQVRTLGLGAWRHTKAASSVQSIWGQVGFITLWAGFWNSVVGVFAYQIYFKPWQHRRLYRWGLPAPGVVEAKHIHRGKNTTYSIDYMFVTPDGAEQKGKHTVNHWAYELATEGQAVTVLHFEGKSKPSVVYEYGGYRCLSDQETPRGDRA